MSPVCKLLMLEFLNIMTEQKRGRQLLFHKLVHRRSSRVVGIPAQRREYRTGSTLTRMSVEGRYEPETPDLDESN